MPDATQETKLVRRDWFLRIIKEMGYNQSAFAESSDISRQTLEKLISGACQPSKRIAKKIEVATGIPASWWIDPPENPVESLRPVSVTVSAQRHINSIGEVAIPAAFRYALGWEFGIDVVVTLDKANKQVIIKKKETIEDYYE